MTLLETLDDRLVMWTILTLIAMQIHINHTARGELLVYEYTYVQLVVNNYVLAS